MPSVMPPTNSAEPPHRYAFGIGRDGACSCGCAACAAAAFSMLLRKSPASAGAPIPITSSQVMTIRRSLMPWSPLPLDLRAELHAPRQDVPRRDAECRIVAELRSDVLEGGVVRHVERVEEHAQLHRRAPEREVLLHANVDQIEVGDAPIARVRFHVDLRR